MWKCLALVPALSRFSKCILESRAFTLRKSLLTIVAEWIDVSTEEKLLYPALKIEENAELNSIQEALSPDDDFLPLVMIKYS